MSYLYKPSRLAKSSLKRCKNSSFKVKNFKIFLKGATPSPPPLKLWRPTYLPIWDGALKTVAASCSASLYTFTSGKRDMIKRNFKPVMIGIMFKGVSSIHRYIFIYGSIKTKLQLFLKSNDKYEKGFIV